VTITLVTPEDAPLALFGAQASDAIRDLLKLRGIEVRLRTVPMRFEPGTLHVAPEAEIAADRVVALAQFEDPRIRAFRATGAASSRRTTSLASSPKRTSTPRVTLRSSP
jgi:NADH dehydrogenase FAD-containing subunit